MELAICRRSEGDPLDLYIIIRRDIHVSEPGTWLMESGFLGAVCPGEQISFVSRVRAGNDPHRWKDHS